MRKFTKLFLVFVFSLSAVCMYAQGDSTAVSKKPKRANKKTKTEVVESGSQYRGEPSDSAQTAPVDKPAASQSDTSQPKGKDRQNQLQFMKPDMESKNYNFYQRKEISTPLMPRYDLDSAVYQKGKKKEKQQQSFLKRQYAFPAKPKDQWELGVNFGSAFISGNVKPYVNIKGLIQNIGGGFTIRKALGYTLSLRLGYNFMMMTGRNWQPDQNLMFNPALHGSYDPRVNYWNNPNLIASKTKANIDMNKTFFYNYRTYVHEAHLAAVVNLGNINFHKERNFVNFYFVGGISTFFFTTYMDALDKNGSVYDFSQVYQLFNGTNNNNVNSRVKNQRKQALDMLDKIYDGKYETLAEHENDKPGIKNWQFVPSLTAGLGVQFHVSKWVTLGLEERILLTQEGLLDGYRWQQDAHPALVSHYDNISYTSININIHLGGKKRTEPLYWLNPVYHSYRKLGEVDPQSLMDQMFKDDDDDGVPNYLDNEPNTKKGCPVDTHGVALDSDHDGIIDCLDKEPYSPPGYPIDSNGVAIIPPNPCCDTSGIGRNSNYDNDMNNPNGPNSGNHLGGVGKERRGNSGYDCSKMELPSVVFDNDKYYLDPQYYGNLHQIAERMQLCPDMKLVVTGYDESRNDQKYNEQLAWNRANSAVDYLVEKYGISRDRFVIKYQGGKKAATGTPFEKRMKNKVEFRYANEGEGGDSNPPAPHPGLKAGSNK
jgi:outer membrane protein OmpA-like peptidoglycan-associated protein